MRIDSRLKKVEEAVRPKNTACIVAYSREEADEKIREYTEKYPGRQIPLIVIVQFIAKPANSGLGR